MYEITLEHTTDTGHRIVGHEGKCARLHGHTYRWVVTIKTDHLEPPGFVIDFGDIKDLLNEWDHRTLLWTQDPIVFIPSVHSELEAGIVRVEFNPTVEHMVRHMASLLSSKVQLFNEVDITVYETPKSCARWVVVHA